MNLNAKQRLVLRAYNINPTDDDRELEMTVWALEGLRLTPQQKAVFRRLTRSETIARRRRELVALGKIKPSESTLKQREEAFKAEREAHSRMPRNIVAKIEQESLL